MPKMALQKRIKNRSVAKMPEPSNKGDSDNNNDGPPTKHKKSLRAIMSSDEEEGGGVEASLAAETIKPGVSRSVKANANANAGLICSCLICCHILTLYSLALSKCGLVQTTSLNN